MLTAGQVHAAAAYSGNLPCVLHGVGRVLHGAELVLASPASLEGTGQDQVLSHGCVPELSAQLASAGFA